MAETRDDQAKLMSGELRACQTQQDKVSQEKEDMRVLTELLNQYAQTGIPALSLSMQGQIGGQLEEDTLVMEDSWRQLVDDPEVWPAG